MRVEALHEAYCVLKPEGKLIIMDVSGDGEGAFDPDGLRRECEELGFLFEHFEDRSDDLATFAAEAIMAGKLLPAPVAGKRKYGYFLMVFSKRV
jgi:hypothetical protein